LDELVSRGAKLRAYDPEAIDTFKKAASDRVNENTEYVDRPSKAKEGVDALVICTEWNEFRVSDLSHFHNYMNKPVVFDGRNLYSLEKAREANITYISVGRPEVHAD
jgi:UDPglucose 6-dehydrogenase